MSLTLRNDTKDVDHSGLPRKITQPMIFRKKKNQDFNASLCSLQTHKENASETSLDPSPEPCFEWDVNILRPVSCSRHFYQNSMDPMISDAINPLV